MGRAKPPGRTHPRAIFREVDPTPLLTPQAVKVLLTGFVAGLMTLLALGFLATGAPVRIALVPLVLIIAVALRARRDLRHVTRHGWYKGPGADGSSGQDPGDPRVPSPQGPSGDMTDPDWDRFVSQFWEHVEREPDPEREPVGG
jgi:hypothetical protein